MSNSIFTPVLLLLALGLSHNGRRPAVSEDTHYPRLIHADLPLYPPLARTAHVSGKIEIQLRVEKGSVVEARIKSTEIDIADPQKSAAYDLTAKKAAGKYLSDPSLANVKTWRFEPQGQAALTVTFIYQIQGEATPLPENPRVELDLPLLVKITAKPFKPTCSDCGPVANRGTTTP